MFRYGRSLNYSARLFVFGATVFVSSLPIITSMIFGPKVG